MGSDFEWNSAADAVAETEGADFIARKSKVRAPRTLISAFALHRNNDFGLRQFGVGIFPTSVWIECHLFFKKRCSTFEPCPLWKPTDAGTEALVGERALNVIRAPSEH